MFRQLFISFLTLIVLIQSVRPQSWQKLGPPLAGRFSGIVASPVDPDILVAASPGGGIWRSTSGGANWTQTEKQVLADNFVLRLIQDKLIPGKIYASTFSDLYVSNDMGISWHNLTGNGGYPSEKLPAKVVDYPSPFTQLILPGKKSIIFWSKPGSGIYYSEDGKTFKQHFPFPGGTNNPDNFINVLCADDSTGRVYFAPLSYDTKLPAKIYRSTCSWQSGKPCLSWESVSTGLSNGHLISDIVWARSANRLMLGTLNATISGTEVYTTITGNSWQKCQNMPDYGNQGPRFYALSSNLIILGSIQLLATPDFGKSWTNIFFNPMHADIRCFHYVPYSSGGKLWTGADGTGADNTQYGLVRWNCDGKNIPSAPAKVSTKGISTWQTYFTTLITKIGISRKRLLTGSQDNHGVVTDDEGISWQPINNPDGCGDRISLVSAPSNPDRAYHLSCEADQLRRTDNAISAATPGEISWITLPITVPILGPANWSKACMAVSPTNPDFICITGYKIVCISLTGGNSWISASLPENAIPTCVMIDNDQSIYAGTKGNGIFRSADQGKTWVPFGMNQLSSVNILKLIHNNAGGKAGTFFAATSKGLYRRLSLESFQFVSSCIDSAYATSDVEVDPSCPKRIYVATGYSMNKKYHRGGILVSHDNGNTFKSITVGQTIQNVPVTDIQVDPKAPRYLYAGTYGAGVWRYDAGTLPPCQ